jgi:hypothetical protein
VVSDDHAGMVKASRRQFRGRSSGWCLRRAYRCLEEADLAPLVQLRFHILPRRHHLRIPIGIRAHRLQECPRNQSKPAQAHTNPIVPEGGFLQVAVSEAPAMSSFTNRPPPVGASDTALRPARTNPFCTLARSLPTALSVVHLLSNWKCPYPLRQGHLYSRSLLHFLLKW